MRIQKAVIKDYELAREVNKTLLMERLLLTKYRPEIFQWIDITNEQVKSVTFTDNDIYCLAIIFKYILHLCMVCVLIHLVKHFSQLMMITAMADLEGVLWVLKHPLQILK